MYRFVSLSLAMILFLLAVIIPSPAEATSNTSPVWWNGEYFDNVYLMGSSKFTRADNQLAFNWGTAGPRADMPADNFSVRWGADPYFEAGTYRFSVLADDGVAVTLDFDNTLVNTLNAGRPGQTMTVDVQMTAGNHHLQVDYQEFGGMAYLYVSWVRLDGSVGGSGTPILPTNRAAAYVDVYELNLRSGPSTGYSRITKLSRNTVLYLLRRTNDSNWVQVQLQNGTVGWVASAYIEANVTIGSLPLNSNSPVYQYLSGITWLPATNFYRYPSLSSTVVILVGGGVQVTLIGRTADNAWVQVRLNSNSIQGWVPAAYVNASNSLTLLPITA